MSDLPVADPTLLTTEALMREIGHVRDMYDTRLVELNLRLQQRFDAQSKALDAALETAQARSDVLSAKIEALNRTVSESQGKSSGIGATLGWIVAAVGLAATIITIILKFNN